MNNFNNTQRRLFYYKLTNMSTHSPLDRASSIAASTWSCKDSPTQQVGRNFTGNFWNLLFKNCFPSVIPSRDSASYSEQDTMKYAITNDLT